MIKATVISDASFDPHTKAAGWAAWVTIDGPIRIKQYGLIKKVCHTSNDAEMYALLNGIAMAMHTQPEIHTLWVQTDCAAVLHSIELGRRNFYDLYETLEKRPHVLIPRHVKGHTNTKDARSFVNRWCDEHAGKVMRKERTKRRQINRGKFSHPKSLEEALRKEE